MLTVFKVGDRAMANAFSGPALKDLERAYRSNKTVIVHGGGDTVTRIAEQLNVPQEFIVSPEGFKSRFTDEKTIDIYTMVMSGKVNKRIVRDLQRVGILAVGLSGLDAGILQGSRKTKLIAKDPGGRRRVVEGGYTGRITAVGERLIQTVLSGEYLPIIAPIALGTEYEPLNVDGDRAAAKIATALHADLLALLTDVDHIVINGEPVKHWTIQDASKHLSMIGPGMNTKVQAAIEAVSGGVKRAMIAPSAGDSPYSNAINGTSGTVITV
ncbi:MAG TPA: [LysW]-aminoadipate/[LysW]-glutamate kinase [Candidatus Bathyarchaeia archaeon]|jgi:acetylglutamate/LysW-gamma-L-alpha-aminoadipate kinase|nr:[LysW]-aminoadipate/[LysW]-glutamate kinase [Candidatus Bathyarchaeia archaeon]